MIGGGDGVCETLLGIITVTGTGAGEGVFGTTDGTVDGETMTDGAGETGTATGLTEISAGGSNLIYSSYFGGTNYDIGGGIAVDPAGYVYVAGGTTST